MYCIIDERKLLRCMCVRVCKKTEWETQEMWAYLGRLLEFMHETDSEMYFAAAV